MPSERPVARFLPTLTEVVKPAVPSTAQPTEGDLIARVMDRLMPILNTRLEAHFEIAMRTQLQHMRAGLQQDLESAVRTALEAELANASQPPVPR